MSPWPVVAASFAPSSGSTAAPGLHAAVEAGGDEEATSEAAVKALMADSRNKLGDDEMSSEGMVQIWKVPLPPGPLLPRNYLDACGSFGMKPVCGGPQGCKFADRHCISLRSMDGECGRPLRSIARGIGLPDPDSDEFAGLCNYMSSRPHVGDTGFFNSGCCGGPGWCNSANFVIGDRWAVCAGYPAGKPRKPRPPIFQQTLAEHNGPLPDAWLAHTFAKVKPVGDKIVRLDDGGYVPETKECERLAPSALHARLFCTRSTASVFRPKPGSPSSVSAAAGPWPWPWPPRHRGRGKRSCPLLHAQQRWRRRGDFL